MNTFLKEHIYSVFFAMLVAIMVVAYLTQQEALGWLGVGAMVASVLVWVYRKTLIRDYWHWFQATNYTIDIVGQFILRRRNIHMHSTLLLMAILGIGAIVAAGIALKPKPKQKDQQFFLFGIAKLKFYYNQQSFATKPLGKFPRRANGSQGKDEKIQWQLYHIAHKDETNILSIPKAPSTTKGKP